MLIRQPWFERRFDFDLPITAVPGLIERLRGTPARIERRLTGLPEARLIAKVDGRWSIQENVGHLLDLEPLWLGRVEDLMLGNPELRPTDLQNRATDLAGHNDRALEDLLNGFEIERGTLVARLEAAEPADWGR